MFQKIKPIWLVLVACMLMATACNLVPDPSPDTDLLPDQVSDSVHDSEEITKEDVRQALLNAAESVTKRGLDIDEYGSIIRYVRIEIVFKSLKVKGKDIQLTKAEFFVDNKLIETQYSEPNWPVITFYYSLPDELQHKISARVYGATCPENEAYTYMTFSK